MNPSSSFLELADHWTLTTVSPARVPESLRDVLTRGIKASVPGEATLDLLRAGLIDDPFDGDNESTQQWIGDVDWCFTCVFPWTDDGAERHDLVAEGLDTVASITLNGVPVAATMNQFRSYRWDVRDHLQEGTNVLRVVFLSPVRECDRREYSVGSYPHAFHHAFNQMRKSASSFGWDWGIDVANAGITARMGIESWSIARIASVRPLADADDDGTGTLTAHVSIERANRKSSLPLAVRTTLTGHETRIDRRAPVPAGRATVSVDLEVPHARLWWPAGYGGHPLYDLCIDLVAREDTVCGSWGTHVGFRHVALNTDTDETGHAFEISVNGLPVHARGYNWIPDDAFPTRLDRSTYARAVSDMAESNSTMVRVWGGGLYETEDFYDLCDRAGIMVWQDLMFACAAYPEDASNRAQIEAEAREQITRLSCHASLVLWNGSNENYMGYVDWPWFRQGLVSEDEPRNACGYREKAWGEYYYGTLFPALLSELDPTRIYTPSAPISLTPHRSPNAQGDGTMHIWDVWNDEDYRRYARYTPRFADEFGYQAPPAWSTLIRNVHDEPLDPFGQQMLVHQKADLGNEKLARGMRSHLTPGRFDDDGVDAQGRHSWLIDTDRWDDMEDWHWACQLQQAQAIRFAVSHMRSLEPINSGMLIWQLNDDWPVVSWSAVDYDGHRKPLWYASKAFFAPRFASIHPAVSPRARSRRQWAAKTLANDCYALFIENDTASPWKGIWTVRRMTLSGEERARADYDVSLHAAGHGRVDLDSDLYSGVDESNEILVAEADDGSFGRVIYDFADVIDQNLADSPMDCRAEKIDGGYRMTIHANSYARDIFCLVDKIDDAASVSDGMVSLLPGDTVRWTVRSARDLAPEAFLQANVLRTANDLHAKRAGTGV
ncbi:MAG: glycoside hydrolase family 2 protein [Bifidobacterium sp.]|jgi:beta-mannosidase